MVYSATVTDGFIRDTEEVNARIFPTTIAIEQSSSHAYLVQVIQKEKVFSYQYFVLRTVNSCRLLLAAISNSRPPSVPNRATCGSKTELARCTETKNRPELGHPLTGQRVQSLTVSAKRKPVHSFHRDVTTKS